MPKLPDSSDVPNVDPGNLRQGIIAAPRQQESPLTYIGDGLTQYADNLAKAEQKVRTREDTISRVRLGGRFGVEVEDDFEKFKTERDPTDPAGASAFGKILDERVQGVLSNWKGTDAGRAELLVDLEKEKSRAIRKAAEFINAQDNEIIDDAAAAAVAATAADVPGSIDGIFSKFDELKSRLTTLRPALGETKFDDRLASGSEEIVLSAAQPYIDMATQESAEALEAITSDPDIVSVLSPPNLRKLKSKVISIRTKAEKGRIEGEQKLAEAAAIIGVPVSELTAQQRLSLSGLDVKGPQSVSDKLAQLRKAMPEGWEPTESVILSLAGAGSGDDPFGKGLAGRTIARITDDATAFANNVLNEQDERRFIAAVVEHQQPIQYMDPDTGLPVSRQRKLPPFAIEALRRRGRDDLIAQQEGQEEQVAQESVEPEEIPGGRTIWQMTSDITGPVAQGVSALGRIPGVGEFVPSASFTQAQTFATAQSKELVRVLQNNPRFSEGERNAIAKDFSLEGEVLDTPKAFKDRLIGMDNSLEIRARAAADDAINPNISSEARKQALDSIQAIARFRATIGLPPLMTPDEARKQPPGTVFRTPDNRILRVPGGK